MTLYFLSFTSPGKRWHMAPKQLPFFLCVSVFHFPSFHPSIPPSSHPPLRDKSTEGDVRWGVGVWGGHQKAVDRDSGRMWGRQISEAWGGCNWDKNLFELKWGWEEANNFLHESAWLIITVRGNVSVTLCVCMCVWYDKHSRLLLLLLPAFSFITPLQQPHPPTPFSLSSPHPGVKLPAASPSKSHGAKWTHTHAHTLCVSDNIRFLPQHWASLESGRRFD